MKRHEIKLKQEKKLLNDYKSWSWSFTSKEKSMKAIKARPDQEHFLAKTENSLFAHTYWGDKFQRT